MTERRRLGRYLHRVRPHQHKISREAQDEGDEPGVRVEHVEDRRIRDLTARCGRGADEAGDDWQYRNHERGDRPPVDAVPIGSAPIRLEYPMSQVKMYAAASE